MRVKLTRGYIAEIDPVDADLKDLSWCISPRKRTAYAFRSVRADGKMLTILMHRVILERVLGRCLSDDEQCDHIDHNGLNNHRNNLRCASKSQNQYNTKRRVGRSGYIGVWWHPRLRKWRAQLQTEGKTTYLGVFDDIVEAARAYDIAARKQHGKFAVLNFTE